MYKILYNVYNLNALQVLVKNSKTSVILTNIRSFVPYFTTASVKLPTVAETLRFEHRFYVVEHI